MNEEEKVTQRQQMRALNSFAKQDQRGKKGVNGRSGGTAPRKLKRKGISKKTKKKHDRIGQKPF